MKNIHILSTDKPSRVYEWGKELKFTDHPITNKRTWCQNIYITSDEEIKRIDYWLNIDNNTISNGEMFELANDAPSCKKIILTTDQDLIKDGVQAIDDEFLEWFVKNPSCEWVEVIKVCSTGRKCDGKSKNCNTAKYKIIIPKETPKTFKELFANTGIEPTTDETGNIQYNFKATMKKEPKQETLEEVAEKYVKDSSHELYELRKQCFLDGAKWQQEQIGKSEFLQRLRATLSDAEARRLIFETFKNK